MACQPLSAKTGPLVALGIFLLSHVLTAAAPAQRPEWAPAHPQTPFKGPTPPLSEEVPRAFELPRAAPSAANPQLDFKPQFAAPDAAESFYEPPLVFPTVHAETDRRWRTLFAQPPRTPWLAQPLSFSKFAGGFGANEPTEDRLGTGIGLTTGVRFGWDYAPRWGVESRVGFARPSFGAPGPGLPVSHENFWYWDGAILFYPWTNTLWRPYIYAGAGMTDVQFIDDVGRSLHQWLFHIPLGIGIKRQIYGDHAFRVDISDNLMFTDMRPRRYVHGVSITAGFEFRFGGRWKWLSSLPVH